MKAPIWTPIEAAALAIAEMNEYQRHANRSGGPIPSLEEHAIRLATIADDANLTMLQLAHEVEFYPHAPVMLPRPYALRPIGQNTTLAFPDADGADPY